MSNINIAGDLDNGSIIDLDSLTITIDLDVNENIEITFNNCALPVIEPLTPQTICSTKKLLLANINPIIIYPDKDALQYTWSFLESGENGMIIDTNLSDPTIGTYMPGADAIARGYVTLILSIDNPDDGCELVSKSLTINFLKADCGDFPWSGNE